MRIHRHKQRKPKFQVTAYRVNEQITAPIVRVVEEDGNSLGELPIERALAVALEKEKDLVEVSPKAEPPVCRLLNYGQFKYQKEKEARKQKAQSKEVEIKGIRLTYRIGEGDLNVRLEQAKKFLERGDKVKIELVLRGREKSLKDVATDKINQFIESLRAVYPLRIEQPTVFQAGRLICIVARV